MPSQFTHSWTEKEIEFVRANIGKLTYNKMGNLINRSYNSIQSKVRYLPFNKKVKKHPVNSGFFKKWSPEMAYVLGFIAADGNICHSGKAFTLHVASDDIDVIQKIRTVIQYLGPIHKKPRLNGKISYSLRICDPIIFKDLEKLGITERKSLTLSPKVSPIFIIDFLRGFFDGDGSVYIRNHKYPSKLAAIFYTASCPMAKFVHFNMRRLLGNLYGGEIRKQISKKGNPYYSIGLGHKASAKLYSIFYTNATIYMDRKFKKFLQGIKHDNP